ncbi:mesothelin-like isoform X1 [Melanerpes formicivorus]|uniref:mesothelin-like isoform X1 n=1 Tax=Melanerpes formicivorus TaxID=211600 RepID=UPI00358E1F2A
MAALVPALSFLLLLRWQEPAAASAGTHLCPSPAGSESALCASVRSASPEMLHEVAHGQAPPCSLTFGQLACAQRAWLQDLQDDFLPSLYSCLSPRPPGALDPQFSILFFSKYDSQKLAAALARFSQRFSHVPLPLEWSLIFFNGLWERLLQVPGIGSPALLSQWLHGGLQPFLAKPQLAACLHAKNIQCETFQGIVASLSGIYPELPVEEQRNLYAAIKHYLLQAGAQQKCFSAALPGLNSTAWFRSYLGPFLEHATAAELQLLGDEPTLQTFARDPLSLQMVSNLTLPWQTAVFYTSLLTSAPDFPLASLPDRFVCCLSPSAVSNLSRDEALSLAQRITENCPWNLTERGMSREGAPSSLSREELQVASSLVRKFEHFPPAVLRALGQAAVGLSISDLESRISAQDLAAALPALAAVRGWSAEQASTIARKLLSSGYQVSDGQSLAGLGSLVPGLGSAALRRLPPEAVLEAVRLPSFAQHLGALPPALKRMLVEKISSRVSHPAELVPCVPGALARYIPKSLLVFGEEEPNIQDLNSKPWTPGQAAMFFSDVMKAEPDFSRLSQSVLQGFTCAAAQETAAARFQELARVMKEKEVRLGEEQLSCLVKLVTLQGIPKDLDSYPKELLLFLSPSDYAATGSCVQFFANIGEANLDVLPRESPQRKELLLEALACLGVPGPQVDEESAELLGHLLCELGGQHIRSSGGHLLKHLSRCGSFLPEQEEAIRSVLSSGNTSFGPPAEWSALTLKELSGLISVLDHSILQQIPRDALTLWLKSSARDSPLSREELASIAAELLPSRQKRADAGCPPGKEITEEVLADDTMNIYYSPAELRACLRNVSLESYLSQILVYPFSDPQLAALKQHLDETYPEGYPASLLPKLGLLLSFVTPEEVSRWNITSADALAGILRSQPPQQQASAAIRRYLALGNPLDATALEAIGSTYLCLLDGAELSMIEPSSLKVASLDPAACSETTKDILYAKAKRAFSGQPFPAYYELIEPYLGGAPAADLRALSRRNLNMGISTLVNLRRDSLMSLTPSEVQGLLGINLPDLKKWQHRAPIWQWIQRQRQAELEKLQLGLTGGTQKGYINLALPRAQVRSSASLGAVAATLRLLPALLTSCLLLSILA